MRNLIIMFGVFSLIVPSAFAKSVKKRSEEMHVSQSSGEKIPYGMSGCGIGALVFKKNDIGSQLASALFNDFFIPQTFPITTGTSNCEDNVENLTSLEKEVFVKANYASISREAAQGSGEHLQALAQILGCKGSGAQVEFGRLSHGHYDSIFGDGKPESVIPNYSRAIKTNKKLAETCSAVG